MKKKKIRNLKDLVEWFKDRWIMPKEFIPVINEKNFSNSHVIFTLLGLFGVCSLLIYLFRHFSERGSNIFELRRHYYFIIISTSFFCLILTQTIKKLKISNSVIKNLPILICTTVSILLSIANFYTFNGPYSGTVLYLCIGLIAVTFFTFPPSFFILAETIICCSVGNKLIENWGLLGLSDIIVISHLMLFMNLFKWRITKIELIRNEMLETHKEVLEDEVVKKSEEIEYQNYELQKQHEKLISIQNNTIISLSNLVENRDSDTGEHVRRTSAYVRLLAKYAQSSGYCKNILTDDYIELLTRAAPMHDIGKIIVSDSILKKPGKLTSEEFEQIKKHTTEGGRIVQEVLGDAEDKTYIQIAIDVATSHHERWDGKGYPHQLKKEDIPLSARIMAIADVFDALVSPRCYKESFPVSKAFEIIKEESGTHFDPTLAELFINIQDDVVAVTDRYSDKKNPLK